jgi:hypothetical protein
MTRVLGSLLWEILRRLKGVDSSVIFGKSSSGT